MLNSMLKPVAKKIKSAHSNIRASRWGTTFVRLATAYGIIAVVAIVLVLTAVLIGGGKQSTSCAASPFTAYSGSVEQLTIGSKSYLVAFALTAEQKSQGLSGTACLPADNAMLFDYSKQPEVAAFWMKDMRYSIDIVWLNAEGEIITIASNVSPTSYPATYEPTAPASYVLEFAAGEVNRQAWQVGNKLLRL